MHELPPIDPALLPPLIKRLLRAIGVPATLQLLQAQGGLPLKIPQKFSPQLAELVGEVGVIALIREFGAGTIITLPMPDKIVAMIRDAAIWSEQDTGERISTQVRRYGLTKRWIIEIRKRRNQAPDETPQTDLF